MGTRRSSTKISQLSPVRSLPAVVLGWIEGYEPNKGALVNFPGNQAGPLVARLLIHAGARTLRQAAASRATAALLFEKGDPTLPLVVGLAQPATGQEVHVDGERIVLTGENEIELRCGDSSIVLSKNGKLVIRGAYVETRARGTNRIKGGSVQIN